MGKISEKHARLRHRQGEIALLQVKLVEQGVEHVAVRLRCRFTLAMGCLHGLGQIEGRILGQAKDVPCPLRRPCLFVALLFDIQSLHQARLVQTDEHHPALLPSQVGEPDQIVVDLNPEGFGGGCTR